MTDWLALGQQQRLVDLAEVDTLVDTVFGGGSFTTASCKVDLETCSWNLTGIGRDGVVYTIRGWRDGTDPHYIVLAEGLEDERLCVLGGPRDGGPRDAVDELVSFIQWHADPVANLPRSCDLNLISSDLCLRRMPATFTIVLQRPTAASLSIDAYINGERRATCLLQHVDCIFSRTWTFNCVPQRVFWFITLVESLIHRYSLD